MVEKESDLKNTVKNLESKIGIIEEQIKTMQKNEEIIGRTLITLNQRVKKLEERPLNVQGQTSQENAGESVVKEEVEQLKAQVKELKYTIDMINPLQYATLDEVKEAVDEIIEKKLKKKV